MQQYKILIPIGGHLPQAGQLIQSSDKDFKGQTVNIMVSTIQGITWGTKKIEGEEKVAGVYVDLLGVPWPQVKLTAEQEKAKAKYRHFVVTDADTGEVKACFNGNDLTQETPEKMCPHCVKRAEEVATMEAVAVSIEDMANTLAAHGIDARDCKTWEELIGCITYHIEARNLELMEEYPEE